MASINEGLYIISLPNARNLLHSYILIVLIAVKAPRKRQHQKTVPSHRRPIHRHTTVPITVKVETIPIIMEPINTTAPTAAIAHHIIITNGNSNTMRHTVDTVNGMHRIPAAIMVTVADTTDTVASGEEERFFIIFNLAHYLASPMAL